MGPHAVPIVGYSCPNNTATLERYIIAASLVDLVSPFLIADTAFATLRIINIVGRA